MTQQASRGSVTAVLATTAELNADTQLLLRLLRQWLFGMRNGDPEFWQTAWNDLAVRYGTPRARRALVAVERFYKVLADGACRTLSIRPVQCGFLGIDEGVMLLLLRRAGGYRRRFLRRRRLAVAGTQSAEQLLPLSGVFA